MAAERFVVTELVAPGADVPGGAARFEWTADKHSGWRRPWTFGTSVRHKRTDYSGGDAPTYQVLGPNSKDQELEGEWDDRWNGAGFARSTRRAFNDMVRRANLVRLEFNGLSWVGLITDAEYTYSHDSKIAYRFTLSPQSEEDAEFLRLPDVSNRPLSASALTDALAEDVAQLGELRGEAPVAALEGTVFADVGSDLDAIEASFAEADGALQQRLVLPGGDDRGGILRMAQLFTQIRGSAASALNRLIVLRSDTEMGYRTAADVLRFDQWTKELGFQLRLLGLHSTDSAQALSDRADPTARALYRPQSGEHIYGISTRFFGSPHHWRSIAARNGLTATVMTGDEILVIAGAG